MSTTISSRAGVEYEVANGESIPNLGERQCQVMTVGSMTPKKITFQIAEVHKPLLSVAACSDMGFDCFLGQMEVPSRIGSRASAFLLNAMGPFTL